MKWFRRTKPSRLPGHYWRKDHDGWYASWVLIREADGLIQAEIQVLVSFHVRGGFSYTSLAYAMQSVEDRIK